MVATSWLQNKHKSATVLWLPTTPPGKCCLRINVVLRDCSLSLGILWDYMCLFAIASLCYWCGKVNPILCTRSSDVGDASIDCCFRRDVLGCNVITTFTWLPKAVSAFVLLIVARIVEVGDRIIGCPVSSQHTQNIFSNIIDFARIWHFFSPPCFGFGNSAPGKHNVATTLIETAGLHRAK